MNQKLKNKKQLMKGVATFFSAVALFTALPHTSSSALTQAEYDKIINSDSNAVKQFLTSSPNLDFKYSGETIFHIIIKGYAYDGETFKLERCKILLKHLKEHSTKTINAMRDGEGNTPLHIACERGYPQLAELFIEHGASIYAQNNEGETPLDVATEDVKKTILPLMFCSQDNFQKYLEEKNLNEMTCSTCREVFNKTTTLALNELKSVFDCKDEYGSPKYAHPICPKCIKNINAFSKCPCCRAPLASKDAKR